MVSAILAARYVRGGMVLMMGYDFNRMVCLLKKRARLASRVCMAARKLMLLKVQTVLPLLPIGVSPLRVLCISCLNN